MSTADLWMRTLSAEGLWRSGLWPGVQMGGEQGSLGATAPVQEEWQIPGQCRGEADRSLQMRRDCHVPACTLRPTHFLRPLPEPCAVSLSSDGRGRRRSEG